LEGFGSGGGRYSRTGEPSVDIVNPFTLDAFPYDSPNEGVVNGVTQSQFDLSRRGGFARGQITVAARDAVDGSDGEGNVVELAWATLNADVDTLVVWWTLRSGRPLDFAKSRCCYLRNMALGR
jgi:hypothetical protein